MSKRALILACLAAAALAPPASATTMKTLSGATLASNTGISGSLKAGTTWHIEGGVAGDIDCSTATWGGTLGTNPNTPSVTGSLTSMTLANCTDTIPFVTASCVTTNVGTGANAKTMTLTYVGVASTLAISGPRFTVCFTNGATCVYETTGGTATAQHDSTRSNNEYSFNVLLTETGGTFFGCPSNPTWTATLRLVRTSDQAGITIQP